MGEVRNHPVDMIDRSSNSSEQISDKPEFADFLNDLLFDRYAERKSATFEEAPHWV